MKADLLVHVADDRTQADLTAPIEDAIRGCGLSGIGIEGMSEYEIKTIDFKTDAEPMGIHIEAEWIGGQFVSRKELTEIITEAICSVDGVLGVGASLT